MIAMKGTHRVDNDCGDGAAMAFRAGGRLVDMEFTFGGTFNVLMKKFDFPSYNVAVAHGARLINARGERFMQQYDPVRLERSELSHVVAAFAKEIVDGRGPVFVDLRHVDDSYWTDIAKLHRGGSILLTRPRARSQGQPAADRADLGAVGERPQRAADRSRRAHQSVRPAGGRLGRQERRHRNACQRRLADGVLQGVRLACRRDGGDRKPANASIRSISGDLLTMLQEQALAPLHRPASPKTSDDLHDDLARLEASVVDGMILNADKLTRMLQTTEEVASATRTCRANDLHDLVKLHEARNVAHLLRHGLSLARSTAPKAGSNSSAKIFR